MNKSIWYHIKRRILSFKYAFNGLFFIIKTQTNMLIHIAASIIVVAAGFYFKINQNQWLAIILSIALVFIAEIVNTAIEEIVNLISPDFNKKAGLIKDIGAAFVLIAAIFAIIIGSIIFFPKIF
jgi:undecaprenol kinase/diacylglycerol kinase (ATP)